jgi:Ca2+-binding EF-hand superfamily protein
VNVTDYNLVKVFEIIDLQQTGKINYIDFVNVVQHNVQLPLEQIVRKRRKDNGESLIDHIEEEIIDPEEKKRVDAYKTY